MSLRQAAFGLLRRLRHSRQTVAANSYTRTPNSLMQNVLLPSKLDFSGQFDFGSRTWKRQQIELFAWMFVAAQTVILGICSSPVLAEDVSIELNSENNTQGANVTDLRKIEDGSVISNVHTSKWRVFTDSGRDFFSQGKLEEAEKFFLSALQEAKAGFGEKDPHVASALNNLAELYRVQKSFDKAEPLYSEALKILEESFGPEDVRVAAALHNLGQFYLVQRKLEDSSRCYERALKIKRRVLGHGHTDYADTMYHLGMVLHLQAKLKDAEILIEDSIRILEEGGLGESMICIRRLRNLSQIYMKSNRLVEAENIQRRILHVMELSKGWNSLDTVIAAEGLGLTLQSVGNLKEAKDLLEKCLEARKTILSEDHIQVAANMLSIARVEMRNSNHLRKFNTTEAVAEFDRAKDHLDRSIRIAQRILYKSSKHEDKEKRYEVLRDSRKDEHTALLILLQSLNALGLLEITRQESVELKGEHSPALGAENAFCQCISAFKEFASGRSWSSSPQIKAEYLSCLKHLSNLIRNGSNSTQQNSTQQSRRATLQGLEDEIKLMESELSQKAKRKT